MNKARQEQAQSRAADWPLLVVDCSNLRMTWDLSLAPDARTVDALCLAVGRRLSELPTDLAGLVVWNPNVPLGEPRRLVAATENVPQLLLDALAGCGWPSMKSAIGLLKFGQAAT